ncbi:MAG: D-tyrosyl-tRNA(Tyr) deacylase [Verrucomicrobiae bacterium]|nr:D-tyrosyl-tRNA(Tyr) deacylase [Verrucomicrobiae bacterium]NNJ43403.1 D-tyrosyl-tRNA(Tyr) deacylase [Akkermansiaceae bacterium]
MRIILQRVSEASVRIDDRVCGCIRCGFVILLGIVDGDGQDDIDWLAGKIARMRVFADDEGKMNLSLKEVAGELLVVSQFTLHASTRKGNRPSFIKAARPETAIPLYQQFLATLEKEIGQPCAAGEFGADMKVAMVNDGPVTIMVDSQLRE